MSAAAFVVLASGCGGGGVDKKAGTGQASDPAAKAMYIARGDDICREFRARRRTVLPRLNRAGRTRNAAELAKVLRQIARYSQKAYDDFSAIPKPRGDEEVLNRYLALERQLNSTLARAADAYARGNVRAGTAIIDSQPTLPDRARKIARDYGFKVCGSG